MDKLDKTKSSGLTVAHLHALSIIRALSTHDAIRFVNVRIELSIVRKKVAERIQLL